MLHLLQLRRPPGAVWFPVRVKGSGLPELVPAFPGPWRPGIRVDFGPEGLAWVERGLNRKVVARNARRATQKATAALYSGAVEALGRDSDPPTTAHIARETMRIIEAAYRSARTGAVVSLGS